MTRLADPRVTFGPGDTVRLPGDARRWRWVETLGETAVLIDDATGITVSVDLNRLRVP